MFQLDLSQMARKVAESLNIRQKSKSIKKETSICSGSANNTLVKNANSLQTTLNSTQASQLNTSASGAINANNVVNNNTSGVSQSNLSASSIQKRVKFTQQEDEVIIKYVQKHGKKWSEISKRLPGRTEVMVRNRYYVKIRKINKEKDNGTCDQSIAQNGDEAGLFYAENSSQDFNEQPSELFLASSQSAITKFNQPQLNNLRDEKQRSEQIEINQNEQYNQNYPLYQNSNNQTDIFNSPIKQGIFEDEGMMPFHQNQLNSLQNIDQHHHHLHHYQQRDQHLFDSNIKEYPNNFQNSHFYESDINQNNEYIDQNISKAVLLQNQQYTQLPFQNGIDAVLMKSEDDDYFEEANKPFKLPKFDLPFDDDFSDISAIFPPIGAMDININNSANTLSQNTINPPQTESAKQEKIQFLQNQISMIENMLNMCKDEIIREFAQRKSISTIADQNNKTFNANELSSNISTPVQQFGLNKQDIKQEAAIQEEAYPSQNNEHQQQILNNSMDIEEDIQGNNKNRFIYEHAEHDLNANDNFNYHLNGQSQIITSLNHF